MKLLVRAAAVPLLLLSACAGTQSALDAVPPPVAIPPSIPAPPLPPSPHSSTLPANTSPSLPAAAPDAATTTPFRVVVAFNSLAAGPDPATEARFLELLAQFEREVGHPLPWSRGSWGMEGEYDACLNLLDASEAQQADFVRQLRAELEPGGRAAIREHSRCGNLPTR